MMNKKAVLDDFADVAYTVIVVLMILFVFSIFTKSQEIKVDKVVSDKDITIQRESLLINYLRTPVSATNIRARTDVLSMRDSELLDIALKNNMTIADLFIYAEGNRDYLSLISDITRTDADFFKQTVNVKFSDDIELNVNPGTTCLGKFSTAQLPTSADIPVIVSMNLCEVIANEQ